MSKPLAFIIEDDPRLSDVFSLALSMSNFATETAQDGQTALTRLTEIIPAFIILDLHLPFVSGEEILRHIRIDERLKTVPVMLATADSRRADYLREQAEIVLLKPISPMQLRELASRILSPEPGYVAPGRAE